MSEKFSALKRFFKRQHDRRTVIRTFQLGYVTSFINLGFFSLAVKVYKTGTTSYTRAQQALQLYKWWRAREKKNLDFFTAAQKLLQKLFSFSRQSRQYRRYTLLERDNAGGTDDDERHGP